LFARDLDQLLWLSGKKSVSSRQKDNPKNIFKRQGAYSFHWNFCEINCLENIYSFEYNKSFFLFYKAFTCISDKRFTDIKMFEKGVS